MRLYPPFCHLYNAGERLQWHAFLHPMRSRAIKGKAMRYVAMLILTAMALTACATEHLVITDSSGRQWPVHIDRGHATMQVTIAGKAYRGHYVDNVSSSTGFVTTFGYGAFMYGYGPFMYPGIGTIQTYNPGNRGRAMLIAKDGDTLDCRYNYQGTTVVGTCRDRSGQKYAITSHVAPLSHPPGISKRSKE